MDLGGVMEFVKMVSPLKYITFILVVPLIFMLSGFFLPAGRAADTTPISAPDTGGTPEPTAMAGQNDIPGTPPGKIFQTVYDQMDEKTASQKQAFGGDEFNNGKYERPFDQEMNYIPQVDLVSVLLNREDPLWIYVIFEVVKPFTDNPSVIPYFLIELDKDLDNRGDVLILTGKPVSSEWSTDSVTVLTNPDLNVGGVKPVKPDTNLSEGRGYYEEIFNNGTGADADLVWSRMSDTKPTVVEIAFKNTLTGGAKGKFIWLPWADVGMLDWSTFEFNDHFTFAEAGYPLKEDAKNYPIKAIWGVDNTCRVASGFTPMGTMPGLCPNYDPVAPAHQSGKECPPCPATTICPPC